MTALRTAYIAIATSAALLVCVVAWVWISPALGQDTGMWCGAAWACEAATPNYSGGGGNSVTVKYAALAISETTYRAGVAYGENSEAQAKQNAIISCAQNGGGNDCKWISSVSNSCVGIAISRADETYGFSGPSPTRLAAWTSALSQCRKYGGAHCSVMATPCASDDPRYAPRFPLPPPVPGATTDPSVVGTWEFSMNPGRWVWEIGANGTYEFWSQAPDLAPAHAGLITAANGKWTLQATAGPADSDGGTYQMQGPNIMVTTGKLGTGAWRRID